MSLLFPNIALWKRGARGAPSPPANISALLKSEIVVIVVRFFITWGLPIWREKGFLFLGKCLMVCPWEPIAFIWEEDKEVFLGDF